MKKLTKKHKYLIIFLGSGGASILLATAITVPILLDNNKKSQSFNLTEITKQMQIAMDNKTSLLDTKKAIVKMHQNGTIEPLSSSTQAAANALATYIFTNKSTKTFSFKLGKKKEKEHQLIILRINNITSKKMDATNVVESIEYDVLFEIHQKHLVPLLILKNNAKNRTIGNVENFGETSF